MSAKQARRLAAPALGLLVLAAAGCSSGGTLASPPSTSGPGTTSTTTTDVTTTTRPPSSTLPPSTSPPTTAATTSTTTTTSMPPPTTTPTTSPPTTTPSPCSTRDFDVAPGIVRAFAGAEVTTFVATNVSATPCTVRGRPTIGFYSSNGALKISVVPARGGGGLGNPPTLFTVQSGAASQFRLETYVTPVNGSSCSAATGIIFGAPGLAATTRVPVALTVCGGTAAASVMEPPSS